MVETNFYIMESQETADGSLRLRSDHIKDGTNYVFLDVDLPSRQWDRSFLKIEREDIEQADYIRETVMDSEKTEYVMYLVPRSRFTRITDTDLIQMLIPSMKKLKHNFMVNINRVLARQGQNEILEKYHVKKSDLIYDADEILMGTVPVSDREYSEFLNFDGICNAIYTDITYILAVISEHAGNIPSQIRSLTCCLTVYSVFYRTNRQSLCKISGTGMNPVLEEVLSDEKRLERCDIVTVRKYIKNLLVLENYEVLLKQFESFDISRLPEYFAEPVIHLMSLKKDYFRFKKEAEAAV